ncbi:hypothetical protein Tsubulata_045506 [Turnera subulata]|uniref:Translocase of chloroplast 159/132 membrane anchor domain-containing protein n=1 Tax=Turnera subulata TaxID=218843 RepID=A0A9Q0JKE2_9ROSI|nr:hypothetical protein Tsubulata_045506 [Turnera subulata]
MSRLYFLNLSRNKFSGILPSNFNHPSLRYVYLRGNNLQGSLTNSFYNCSYLTSLDLSNNNFTGGIPDWIGSLYELRFLKLSDNNLEGEIPIGLCKLQGLIFVDLSHNNFSGHIRPCIRCANSDAPIFYLASQSLLLTAKGASYVYKGRILKNMSGIDLSCNNLSGKIPHQFGDLGDIKVLNLSHNILTGEIPTTFSKLKQIETMDLSFNNLNGTIPPQLVELSFLSAFSLAHNNLSGKTPQRVGQFGTFDEDSYRDNPYLCGPPLEKSCGPPPGRNAITSGGGEGEEEGDDGFVDMGAFRDVCGVTCGGNGGNMCCALLSILFPLLTRCRGTAAGFGALYRQVILGTRMLSLSKVLPVLSSQKQLFWETMMPGNLSISPPKSKLACRPFGFGYDLACKFCVICRNLLLLGCRKSEVKKNGVQLQLESLREDHVALKRLDFPALKLSVVGGRPFSCGGEHLFRKNLLSARYGVQNMDESANRIYNAAVGSPEEHLVIFLAHNGPKGLGSNLNYICGKDWVPGGGDHGDPDLEKAICLFKERTKIQIPLVVFGHMHKELAHGNGLRTMIVVGADKTIYLNAAIVPRVQRLNPKQGASNRSFVNEETSFVPESGGTTRAFTLVQVLDSRVHRITEAWVSVIGDEATLQEEQILFDLRLREPDYPIGQDQSSLGLSLVKWKGDLALGANLQSQFSVGRSSKIAVRAGLNNKMTGQITVRTSSSDQLQLALVVGLLPIAMSIYKAIRPGISENYMY